MPFVGPITVIINLLLLLLLGSPCLPQQDPRLRVPRAHRDLRPESRQPVQDRQQARAPPGAGGQVRGETEEWGCQYFARYYLHAF